MSEAHDFIQQFLDYTSSYESPTEFFYWSAVAGISAALRDNCYLLLGDTRIYPNLYILIVAKPAMRKAKPLNSAIELLKVVNNTKIIEGRTSIQAMIGRLSEMERHKDGKTISGASGIIFSEEISAMFTEDDANIPVLTDLYDYKSSYTSSLISRGTQRLTNVVVSLLGASNEELLKPVFNNRAIYGGLLSRCLIVYGDRVRHRNSLMYEIASKYDPNRMQRSFRDISNLKGLVQLTDAARVHYNEWYLEVCPTLEKQAGATGAEGRIHTNILKVAIVLAVARTYTLTVEECDVQMAIEKCQSLFVNYRRLTMGSGKSKEAEPAAILLSELWGAPKHTLTRTQILRKRWADISDETLDAVTTTMLGAGYIIVDGFKERGDQVFKLTVAAVKEFEGQRND